MDDAQLRASLWPDEKVLWSGHPSGGIRFTAQDWFALPFGVVWLGVAISFFFQDGFNLSVLVPDIFFIAVFLGIGFYVAFGRFLLDMWLRTNTAYAITNQRAVILRGGLWPANRSVGLNSHLEMNLIERPNGSGTIRFGSQKSVGFWGNRPQIIPSLDPSPQFLFIDDVSSVFKIVQKAAVAAK